MRVAVPLLDDEVAPRFGFADSFLVADVEDDEVVSCEQISTRAKGWMNRLSELKGLGVVVILCGGFNRLFFPLAQDLGIRVLAGQSGNAESLIRRFVSGEELPSFTCNGWGNPPGMFESGDCCRWSGQGKGRRRGHGRGGQGGQGWRRQGSKNSSSRRSGKTNGRGPNKTPAKQGD